MIHKKVFLLPIILLAFSSFESSWPDIIRESNYYLKLTPPGTIKITENFYCDVTEISNVHWREYMYWIGRIFGQNSKEYLATLPDTAVWLKEDICLKGYSVTYLRHPEYDFYPLVAISREQAIAFSKWRSDRVFERLLIELNKTSENHQQTRENYFTIEAYFKGTYKPIYPGKKVLYYPEYRLPDMQERAIVMHFADSVDKAYFNNYNLPYCKQCKVHNFRLQAGILPCNDTLIKNEPTRHISEGGCEPRNKNALFNMRGNVSEWAFEKEIAFGGGWKDAHERIIKTDTFQVSGPNVYTGFRNICEWEKWKE